MNAYVSYDINKNLINYSHDYIKMTRHKYVKMCLLELQFHHLR